MAYAISFTKEVGRQIGRLPGKVKATAKRQIAGLSDDPRPMGSRELAGHPTYFRLWIDGTYRLVWRVDDDNRVVEIEYVGPKTPDLYTFLGLGRPSENE